MFFEVFYWKWKLLPKCSEKRSLFFLKLSATEDSIENISRNKLQLCQFLVGRFTILFRGCPVRKVADLPNDGSKYWSPHPPFSLSVFSLTLFSLLTRKENIFLFFLSLSFPCLLANKIFFCFFLSLFFLIVNSF